jgi:hypothetical protein
VNLLEGDIEIIKNTGALIDASEEVGAKRKIEKAKYMWLPHQQNAGENQNIKIGNRSFENV